MSIVVNQIQAQSNWFEVENTVGNFNFKMPEEPIFHQEDSTMMYLTSIMDTTIIMQAHYTDQNQSDVLAQKEITSIDINAFYDNFVKLMLVDNENFTLESLEDVTLNNNIKGKEIGIKYQEAVENDAEDQITKSLQTRFMFMRIFWYNQRTYIFTIDCLNTSLADLPTYKNTFFQSIFIHN
ncbi:MAG: hypothetical protein EAZ85_08985 [Bacteroidetes bacterium]|nr:MAG: hypothetical protein EAZ85_08985 [Bacteroidota bacterium]TAG88051.1 MAG: hypothetical protein EAZ20_09320 [Bacteroidota bacterium]